LLTRTSPIDAVEGGVACVETKYRCRRFVNNSVFADRKLTGDNGRSHLFLLRNSILLGIVVPQEFSVPQDGRSSFEEMS